MGASKRLHNAGDPLDGSSESIKKGLKGSSFGIHKTKPSWAAGALVAPTRHDGHPDVSTGDAGVEADGRVTLDSDRRPLGTDHALAAPSTFTVATGSGAAGTFDVTAANETGSNEVLVYNVDPADSDVDGEFIDKFDIDGTGSAEAIDLSAYDYTATVAVYCRRLTTDEVPGPLFATRRVATVHT